MTSQKLDLKYRPMAFENLVGQPVPQKFLSRVVLKAHGTGQEARNILACGPTGCGKTSAARLYGRALNCLSLQDNGNPCNVCAHCELQLHEGFADYHEQNAGAEGGKEAILDLLSMARTPPLAGKWRVLVLDEAQAMTRAAMEDLKNIMEAPLPYLVVVLTTTHPEAVLKDIRDRCSPLTFKRVQHHEAVAHLVTLCGLEGLRYERPALELIAFLERGHLRPLVSRLDQIAAYGDVTLESTQQVCDLGYVAHLPKLWGALLRGNLSDALEVVQEWDDEPDRIVDIWREFLLWMQCKYVHNADRVVNPVFSALPAPVMLQIIDALQTWAKAAGMSLEQAFVALSNVLGLAQVHNTLLLQQMVHDLHHLLHVQGFDAGRMVAPVAETAKPTVSPSRKGRQFAQSYLTDKNGVATPVGDDTPMLKAFRRAEALPVPSGASGFASPSFASPPSAVVSATAAPGPSPPSPQAPAEDTNKIPKGSTGGEFDLPAKPTVYTAGARGHGWKRFHTVSDVLAPTASVLTGSGVFSYADLDPKAARVAQDVAVSIRETVCTSYLAVGRQLTTVKELLPHGQFTAWAEAELDMTARTAENMMSAAKFVEGKPETVSLLPPTILYKLAAPSAPPELVQAVVEAAVAEAPLAVQTIKERLETAQLTRREAAQHKKALKKAQRRNPELTSEQLNARQDKERRRSEAQEAKQQAEQDRKRQEQVARWRPIAERMAHAVADDAAVVRAALGPGGWDDRQVLLAELLAALGGNMQIGA